MRKATIDTEPTQATSRQPNAAKSWAAKSHRILGGPIPPLFFVIMTGQTIFNNMVKNKSEQTFLNNRVKTRHYFPNNKDK